jgi:hypothetical protein
MHITPLLPSAWERKEYKPKISNGFGLFCIEYLVLLTDFTLKIALRVVKPIFWNRFEKRFQF